MANNDSSFPNIRFDAISQTLQYAVGNNWFDVPSSGGSIAAVSLTAQAADTSSATLFTSSSTGLYRVSLYACTTTSDAGAGTLTFSFAWTDDSGAQSTSLSQTLDLTGTGASAHNNDCYEVVSGDNFSYEALGGGTYGTAEYSLYIVAEKI